MTQELKNFFPTPESLIEKMTEKIDKNRNYYDVSILEPSAGRGDIADYLRKNFDKKVLDYRGYRENPLDIDCIELNENLQKILTGKGFNLIYDDFLDFSTHKIYDIIMMNPPFDNGDKHLLKAISLMEETGGQIISLLNAETIKNPYSVYRKDLINKLNLLNAEIEFLKDEFIEADRKTNVEIALININIPKKRIEGNILSGMFKAKEHQEEKIIFTNLTIHEYLQNLISTYNFELEIGIRLIREYRTVKTFLEDKKEYIEGIFLTLDTGGRTELTENLYIEKLRSKYWKMLYYKKELVELFTSSIRQKYFSSLTDMKKYDFNEFNIKQMLKNLSNNMESSLKEDIIQLFDDLSIKYHWNPETENNIHYYNGWCTNKSYFINKKVIIPLRCIEKSWDNRWYFEYGVKNKIQDLHKIFTYLDTHNRDKENVDVHYILGKAEEYQNSKNIEFPYFKATFYKKGTCHITFKDDDLLLKFNIFGNGFYRNIPAEYFQEI